MQAQIMAFDAISEGTGIIIENIFETRFKHVPDLRRMGADITVHGDVAVVRGVRKLYGAEVHASDLRGGSALVLAGLKADFDKRRRTYRQGIRIFRKNAVVARCKNTKDFGQ